MSLVGHTRGGPAKVAVVAGALFGTISGSPLISSILGVMFVAAGVEGYLLTKTNWWQRILVLGGGICLFIPGWISDIIGLAVVALPLIWQWRMKRISLVRESIGGQLL